MWLTKDYPRQPPIVYVVPTQDMLVRPSKYVDVSGRCNIEYIQHWQRKSEVRLVLIQPIDRSTFMPYQAV